MSSVANLAPGVERTLFKRILIVGRDAVGAAVGPLYCIRLPPMVHRTRYGSAFCGRKLAQTRRYVGRLPGGISWRCIHSTVCEPGVSSLERPLPMRANSLEQASSHLSFALVFKRCRYSNCLPVDSSRTALIDGEMGDFIGRDGRGREE